MRVLGLDPGSRFTGYGLVDSVGGMPKHVDNGVWVLPQKEALSLRLGVLAAAIDRLVAEFQPSIAAVEKVFTARNVHSAIVLAHARGVLLGVLGKYGIPVVEYAPAEVKSIVTGYGRAEKAQMQKMTRLLLGLAEVADTDASDALAVALCHVRLARPHLSAQLARG